MRALSEYEFRRRAGRIHGSRYSYDLVIYKHSTIKVTILCPKHGPFEQRPADHLRGYGCDACRKNKPALRLADLDRPGD